MMMRPLTARDFMTNADQIRAWLSDLEEASQGEYTADQLVDVLGRDTHQMFYFGEDEKTPAGVLVTTQAMYAEGKTLVVLGVGGDVEEGMWSDMTKLLNGLAHHFQCVAFEIKCDRNDVAEFQAHGWDEKYVIVNQPIFPMEAPADVEEEPEAD